jgi:hypothetical protein
VGKKWKKKAPILPRLLAVSALLCLIVVYFRRPASETALVQAFYRHLPDFLELRSMVATNAPIEPATPIATSADTPLWSIAHYHRYCALLHRAGVIGVFQEGQQLILQLENPPNAKKGERIGVTWSESQPDCLVANFKEFHKKDSQLSYAFRPLTNDWYLWVAK